MGGLRKSRRDRAKTAKETRHRCNHRERNDQGVIYVAGEELP